MQRKSTIASWKIRHRTGWNTSRSGVPRVCCATSQTNMWGFAIFFWVKHGMDGSMASPRSDMESVIRYLGDGSMMMLRLRPRAVIFKVARRSHMDVQQSFWQATISRCCSFLLSNHFFEEG
mmetsp:Transcript_65018/g.119873  ORF Transcript_65018/g.119873 Transcript_65018/m.119873 type:complete len:121 (+) Transcript_65018:121-483(+)